jgi:Tol biopolymer transport system component
VPQSRQISGDSHDFGLLLGRGDVGFLMLIFRGFREDSAVWSPDGRTILFNSTRKGHFDLYRRPSDGSGPEELLYADNCEKRPADYSPDGRFLLYFASCDAKTGSDLWVLPLKPEQPGAPLKPFPFVQTPALELDGQFSPDGRWIAYKSNESGRDEIYAAPFRGQGARRASNDRFRRPEEDLSDGGGMERRFFILQPAGCSPQPK